MFKLRLVSGILIGVVVVLAANYLPPIGEWLLIVAIACLAQLEFYSLVEAIGISVFRVVGLMCGAILISATFFAIGPQAGSIANAYRWENIVLIGSVIAVFVRQFPQKYNPKPIETIACTLFGILYVPFLFNYFTRLGFAWDEVTHRTHVSDSGRLLMIYLLLVVKGSDIGAFFVGKFFGRHKLFPRISPNKTWEGLIGGVSTSLAASIIFCYCTKFQLGRISLSLSDAIILGFLLSIAGIVGDMFESLLKRAANKKDSGAVIPGMGGVLDVLDSLLFGAPVLYAYIAYHGFVL